MDHYVSGNRQLTVYSNGCQRIEAPGEPILWYQDGVWAYIRKSSIGGQLLVEYEGPAENPSEWSPLE